MLNFKTDRDIALEIIAHGNRGLSSDEAVAIVQSENPTRTLNHEAIAEWIEFFMREVA